MDTIQCKDLLDNYKELHNLGLINNNDYVKKVKEIIDKTMDTIQCKDDLLDNLDNYKELHNLGLINNNDYVKKVKEIIDKIK